MYSSMDSLKQQNAQLRSAYEASELARKEQEAESKAQADALEELQEKHAEVVAENERFTEAFDGFSGRLETDEEIEEKINSASEKALRRVFDATGGKGETNEEMLD